MTTHLTKIWWDLNKHKLVEQAIPEAEIYKREWKGEEHMTRDDIIKLAREAGFIINAENEMTHSLERFAALIAAAEREACAQVCEEEICNCCWTDEAQAAAEHLAATIRARGNT